MAIIFIPIYSSYSFVFCLFICSPICWRYSYTLRRFPVKAIDAISNTLSITMADGCSIDFRVSPIMSTPSDFYRNSIPKATLKKIEIGSFSIQGLKDSRDVSIVLVTSSS